MILLTGATGFLGSNILERLLSAGWSVAIIVRAKSDYFRIEKFLSNPLLTICNIDEKDPKEIFEKNKVKAIIHTATEYGREGGIAKILEANLVLPIRLIEMGIQYGVSCFINTDSYFNKYDNSYSHLLNYSLSKKSLLVWLKPFSNQIRIINVVLEHMYGPYDSKSKFVENLIQKIAIEQEERVKLTHGHQKRDFVYVDEVVDAFLLLLKYGLEHQFSFKTFEVGTGKSSQIRDFAEEVKRLSGSQSILGFGDIAYRDDEMMNSVADINPLLELGWCPKFNTTEGIKKILSIYRF